MGAYDEDEHRRRAEKTGSVDTSDADSRTDYHGTLEYESGESAEALLDQFERIKEQ